MELKVPQVLSEMYGSDITDHWVSNASGEKYHKDDISELDNAEVSTIAKLSIKSSCSNI